MFQDQKPETFQVVSGLPAKGKFGCKQEFGVTTKSLKTKTIKTEMQVG